MLTKFALLVFFSFFSTSLAAPYVLRLSCGARKDIRTKPTNTLWNKDYAYTGGVPIDNATRPSYITPPLSTLRFFPLSEGSENCYNIKRVPSGHYLVRIFYGLIDDPNFDSEPLFDVSVQGTLVDSLSAGWSGEEDRVFAEALVFLTDGTVSICFHSTGHGDPTVISIEILQVDDKAYFFGSQFGRGSIFKTVKRISIGTGRARFGEDYGADPWGGDRFWNSLQTFGQSADKPISIEGAIKKVSTAPNFYPQGLYQSALVSTDVEPEISYTIDVEPKSNYSVWLHFAEIDPSITKSGERVFNILINGDVVFKAVDVFNMSGDVKTALVLNTTVPVDGRTLTISLQPIDNSLAIINALEVFQVIAAEAKTLSVEVAALGSVKKALQLPSRLGWNGDPCVPQQHPWAGADCLFDSAKNRWVIDGLGLDNQGLRGSLPNDISKLSHLQSINLSGNSIHGSIPSAFGSISTLEILDLSYNFLNGSIPDTLGNLNSLRTLNLNGNKLSGRVPAGLGGRLLHRASFNFTDNAGLCGIPGLPTCGPHLSAGAKLGIVFGACLGLLFMIGCLVVWYKRRQNILRTQRLSAREAPYAKRRTHFSRDVQMTIHQGTRTAAENGPILLS